MNKFLKIMTLSIIVVTFVFLLTGCGKKEEAEKREGTSSVFEVKQFNDKSITIDLDHAKVGEEKEAKLVIEDGEDINVKTKMEGAAGITVYYFKAGSEHNKEAADSEYLNGEGESKTEDFPAGEYEVVFEITDDAATGNIEINIK